MGVALFGCNRDFAVLELKPGNVWTYEVTSGLVTRMVEMSVGDAAPVGRIQGYRVVSDLGDSTIAWQGDTLMARQLGGTRFDPPIPLARSRANSKAVPWRGSVLRGGKLIKDCRATLTAELVKEKDSGSEVMRVLSTLTLHSTGPDQTVSTWMGRGPGIVRQEHRQGGVLLLRMRYVSGP